jgi:alkyl sulfatase BDS1-like metallo-beta-lactamase superfamily hydrolase
MSNQNLDGARQLVANDDRKDFDFATRRFIATLKDPKIMRSDGRAAVDLSAYDFLQVDAALYMALAEMIEPLVPNFPIVTP